MTTLAVLALATCGSAAIISRQQQQPGFLSFPVERRVTNNALSRRDDEVTLINQTQTTYLFQLEIGTPPQSVDVVLDTGSFELWVGPTCDTASTSDQETACEKAGQYDFSSSSTAKDEDVEGQLAYGKGQVDIEYVSDTIAVPGTNQKAMTEVTFGVGQGSQDLAYGICGIGQGNGYNTNYPNLIDELASQGITNSKAFSVALGSKDANNGGVVIFGGVDTKKFSGKLFQFTNLPPQDEGGETGPYRYWVQLDSIGITKPGSSSSNYAGSSMPIVLDTGSTLSYLPSSILSSLATDFGATVASDGTLVVPCSTMSQGGHVDFTFGQLTIKVPYEQFIWEVLSNQCVVAVAPQQDGTPPLLGDSFLRSAYVVMDQDNQHIFLAPYASCGQNEKTLPAGAGAAGNFTGECTLSAAAGSLSSLGAPWLLCTAAVAIQAFVWLL